MTERLSPDVEWMDLTAANGVPAEAAARRYEAAETLLGAIEEPGAELERIAALYLPALYGAATLTQEELLAALERLEDALRTVFAEIRGAEGAISGEAS